MSLKCSTCGATNADTAIWCNQCYTPFSKPEVSEPFTASVATALAEQPSGNLSSEDESPGETAVAAGSKPDPTGAGWTCTSCDSPNPLDINSCTVCGASIYDAFGAERHSSPDVEPRTALLWALFLPGMGHVKSGEGLLGLTLAALIVFSAVASASFASASQSGAALFFGMIYFGLSAISIVDAVSLANGNTPLLYGRRITILAGVLVSVIIILVISQLGGS